MKLFKTLLALGVLFIASKSYALTEIDDVANSTCTYATIQISSMAINIDPPFTSTSTLFLVEPSTYALLGRKTIDIQNMDTANDIYCGFDVNVSSIVGNINRGHKLYFAGGEWILNLRDRNQNGSPLTIWCRHSATSGSSDLQMTQCGSK